MVFIVFEELINTFPQHFESNAHVTVEVEAIKHRYTPIFASGIVFANLVQDIDLKFGSLTIFLDIFDDF